MSAPWISGGRVWSRVIERELGQALLQGAREEAATRAMHTCTRVWRLASETLGPASGASAVWGHLVRPCARALGWSPGPDESVTLGGVSMRVAHAALGPTRQVLLAMPWGIAQDGLQRVATRLGAQRDVPWVAVCNGQSWRWYDATRPYAREHLCIDLAQGAIDARVWQALWLLGQRLHSTRGTGPLDRAWIERLASSSESEGAGAAQALRDGVSATLVDLARHARGDHDEHMMLVFQWLFLLFAEARALVPAWNPAHRRSYSLTTLVRDSISMRQPPLGVHESLVAIGRMGRDGTTLGTTQVTALNGPLFGAKLRARRGVRVADSELGAMLSKLTHGSDSSSGTHIDFAQLGVEHLGALYERLMAPPAADRGPELMRKRTGAFYTPRLMADLLVERTLDPLVRTMSSREILGLRILDPAMGSGALLASMHRYLVASVEAAWVREGRGGPLDVSPDERESLPRRIAEQCLYGVDVNPRAVQVARLSLWLLSLAPDRPLTWLDGHLRVGNSLVGAAPATILARPPGRDRTVRHGIESQLTLFDLEQWHHEAAEVGPLLESLSARPTDSAADAHEKSRLLGQLRSRDVLAMWRARADAWCGAVMDVDPPAGGIWRTVDDSLRGRAKPSGAALGPGGRQVVVADRASRTDALAHRWQALADAQHCLHWSLEFPDVFEAGRGGFDAVIANPPWEMLRADLGSGQDRIARRDDLGPLARFVRRSGLYRATAGHVNSYQLFLERMLHLQRPGGRLGCLLPGGVLVDHGAAALRRHLFDHAEIDRISVFDNRDALFPIHRSMRIVSITGSRGAATDAVLVDDGLAPGVNGRGRSQPSAPRLLSRALLRRASGEHEAIPALRSLEELRVLELILRLPRLGGEWRLRFGRELNATEDRDLWGCGPRGKDSLSVVDGKHLQAFSVHPPEDGAWTSPGAALGVLPDAPWRHWRLAYRDVSSPSNARSLIAALLPPGCVSTHTVFCLRTRVGLPSQLYLCALLNSLVADWFVRRFLGAHVTTRLMANLPLPRVPASDTRRRRVVRLATRLMRAPDDERAQADLQVVAADLYGLDAEAMAVVASDFPHLPGYVRDRLCS